MVEEKQDVKGLKADLAKRVEVPLSKLSFLEPLPPELLQDICENFDPGTKDGKHLKRLEAYVRSVAERHDLALEPPGLPPGLSLEEHPGAQEWRVQAFVNSLEMGIDILELLRILPLSLQVEVVNQFDVQGTRDGNLKSRFISFVRGVWLRHLQVNREVGDFFKDFPEDLQVEVMRSFDPSGTKDGNVSARLQSFATRRWRNAHGRAKAKRETNLDAFVRGWGLDCWAYEVLWALPDELRDEVCEGFDGSSTRDGNVGGRFLGYVRSKWAKQLELEPDVIYSIKQLPQEGQLMCMTEFDPYSTRDGNYSARMRGFLWKVEAQLADARRAWRHNYGWSHDPRSTEAIRKFVSRYQLERSVGAYLETLKDPDVLARVLEEFDPTDAQHQQDVLARLKSFVRLCGKPERRMWKPATSTGDSSWAGWS